jgi:hypothetical protein
MFLDPDTTSMRRHAHGAVLLSWFVAEKKLKAPTFFQRNYLVMVAILGVGGGAVIFFGASIVVVDLQMLQDHGFEWTRLKGLPVLAIGAIALVSGIRLGKWNPFWIDVNDPFNLEDWSKKLQVPAQWLLEAVEAVGPRMKYVRRYLADKRQRR